MLEVYSGEITWDDKIREVGGSLDKQEVSYLPEDHLAREMSERADQLQEEEVWVDDGFIIERLTQTGRDAAEELSRTLNEASKISNELASISGSDSGWFLQTPNYVRVDNYIELPYDIYTPGLNSEDNVEKTGTCFHGDRLYAESLHEEGDPSEGTTYVYLHEDIDLSGVLGLEEYRNILQEDSEAEDRLNPDQRLVFHVYESVRKDAIKGNR